MLVEEHNERDFTFSIKEHKGFYQARIITADGINEIESAWTDTPKKAVLDIAYDLFLYWANHRHTGELYSE